MALSESSLAEKIHDIVTEPPSSTDDFIKDVCDAVDKYLEDIEIDIFPAPGVDTSSGSPVPDPTFNVPPSEAVPEEKIKAAKFRSKFEISVNNSKVPKDGIRDFSLCTAAFKEDIATLVKIKGAGYSGEGETLLGSYTIDGLPRSGPDIDKAYEKGDAEIPPTPEQPSPSPNDFALAFAKEIHNATINSVYTGASWEKALFKSSNIVPEAPPHTSNLK